VYTTDPAHTFSSIEWRFPNTRADIINNLVNDTMLTRDGAIATQSGNISDAQASWFVNVALGDLHLVPTATSAIDQVTAPSDVTDDYDGDPRPIGSASDVGADEYGAPPPSAVTDLRVIRAVTATGTLTATLRWTAPANAVTTTLRHSGTLITEANWASASLLADTLSGTTQTYTATVAYTGGIAYFALKSQNAEGAWSALSNNAFWPPQAVYLPLVMRAAGSSLRSAAAISLTTVEIRDEVQVAQVKRLGINIGSRTWWGAAQFLKNLIDNPGFEAGVYSMVAHAATGSTGQRFEQDFWDIAWNNDTYNISQPVGFWNGAEYEIVYGPAQGRHGVELCAVSHRYAACDADG
jgi:hypothetical protein